MRKGKRQPVVLSALILLMAVLCLIYFILDKFNANKAADSEQGGQSLELYTMTTDAAKKLSIKGEYGTFSFIKEDVWKNEADEDFPVEQSKISDLLNKLEVVEAESEVVKDCKDLSEYGLEQPSLVIYLETEEGVSAEISLGNEVPVKGGNYALVDGGRTVYTMDSSYYTAFHNNENYFMEVESGPVIDEASISYFLARKADGTYFEAQEDENGMFQIKGAWPETLEGDTSGLHTLFTNYTSVSYDDVVTYRCEDPSQYGIDKNGSKLIIHYKQEQKETSEEAGIQEDAKQEDGDSDEKAVEKDYTLYIGNRDGKGNYYVQPKGSSYIYTCNADTIDGYLTVDAFSCISPYLLSDTLDMIQSVAIQTKKEKNSYKIFEKDEEKKGGKESDPPTSEVEEDITGGENKESVTYRVRKDGKEVDYQKFVRALTSLQELKYAEEIKENKGKGGSEEAIAKIVVKTENGKRTIAFLPYDEDNYYRVRIDGKEYFLTEKKAADNMLSLFRKVK